MLFYLIEHGVDVLAVDSPRIYDLHMMGWWPSPVIPIAEEGKN
jgi:hypothetical protein